MLNDIGRAHDARHFLDAGCDRNTWHKISRAAIAAGVTVDELEDWSSTAGNYAETRDIQAAFRTIKPDGGTGARTLIRMARDAGWTDSSAGTQRQAPAPTRPVEPQRKPAPGIAAADVWSRCQPATYEHPYITQKQAAGVPLNTLRVLPANDGLHIGSESMAGALVVPVIRADGMVSSLQFVTNDDTAVRLKAKGMHGKLNLPGANVEGCFTVGNLAPGGVVYIVEGIGAAWSCWQATGAAAVVCFGWGRVRAVATNLRQRDPSARLVLVPDVGKESDAQKIAVEVSALMASMPEGKANNFDANDLAQRDGGDVLAALLEAATELPKPAPRYKLLGADDLRNMPALQWRVRGVLPAEGPAGLYRPSASGKSFLALDMAAAIAEGRRWFDYRVQTAPVVYAALEGEAGFKLRVASWEAHAGRASPAGLHMVLQPFKMTEPQDVADFSAVVPAGAVVFLDTLN